MRSAVCLTFVLAFGLCACDGDPTPIDARSDVVDVSLPDLQDTGIDAVADIGVDLPPEAAPPDVFDAQPEVPSRCTTDADCAGMPGMHACDIPSGRCVGCNTTPDTCPAEQHCDGMSRTCVAGCRSDEGCTAPNARCMLSAHRCVGCLTSADCMLGSLCQMNLCTSGCDSTHGCPTGQGCCTGRCINTATDLGNCGGCGDICTVPNGTPQCVGGVCGPATCREPFGNCDGNGANGCEANLETDPENCGGCGRRCPVRPNATPICVEGECDFLCNPNYGDCDRDAPNGCEIDTRTSASHCVVCGHACPTGVACSAVACPFGAAPDGALSVTTARTLTTAAASADAARGATVVTLSHVSGVFASGQQVLLHQTQAPTGPVGYYEYARIRSVTATTMTLDRALLAAYRTDTTARAQVVVVPEYSTVSVAGAGVLNAPPWTGFTGGILAFDAQSSVTVSGRVSMDARGFRGNRRTCAMGTWRCMRGVQGESGRGVGRPDILANGQGGGGGGAGDHCASGGGGGHGTYGDQGFTGTGGMCAEDTHPPGAPGRLGGVAGLMFSGGLGAAGGEGGGDDDGSFPGHGGNGGGAIFIRAQTVTLTGEVSADGEAAGNGDNMTCAGSRGCGMGGGGGGAGGTVRIVGSVSASLGSDLVHARGGDGGQCNCGAPGDFPGGVGGVGRVGVRSTMATGSTTPTFNPG